MKHTHIGFDGEKIFISEDIIEIFNFLTGIEGEIKALINLEEQLKKISEQHQDTIKFVAYLMQKLEENKIEYEINLSERPETILEKLKLDTPLRSQIMVLFSYLETLLCFHIAYVDKTAEKKHIQENANAKRAKKFINKYLLTSQNAFYEKNRKRLSRISSGQLRDLRNSLFHFFSVSGDLNISHKNGLKEAIKLENKLKKELNYETVFITPEDIYELLKEASLLMLREWSLDFSNNSQEFHCKIEFVKEIVNQSGSVKVEKAEIDGFIK